MSKQAASGAPVPIPGPKGLPLLGVALDFRKDPLRYMEASVQRYGRLFKLPLGKTDFVLLNDADDIERITRLDSDKYSMSHAFARLTEPALGNCMAVIPEVKYWQELHNALLPMFTPRMLMRYHDQTVEGTMLKVDTLARLADNGQPVLMYQFAREVVFVSLLKTVFVRGFDPAEVPGILADFTKLSLYMQAHAATGGSAFNRILPVVREGKRARQRLFERVQRFIDERRASPCTESQDMLDVLLSARLSTEGTGRKASTPELSDVELRDNIMMLLFGGQETSPGAITWSFGLLAQHPDKRRKMLDEIDTVLEGRMPTFADLGKLPYTEQVMEEAMRLYPAFTFMGREALEDTQVREHSIRKGTSLGFVAWTVHRDPALWPQPDAFIPERHSKEAKRDRKRCAYLAFGYGSRRCIGERVGRMEVMLALITVSQRYLLDHVDGQMPAATMQNSLKPANGMPMLVRRRTDAPALQHN